MSKSICSTGLRWLWVVVAVLIIDLGSKFLILQNFALGETVPLFPSLNLHYARNYGAAFSFLADSGGWQRWFFSGIAIGICVVLTVLMYRSKATQKLNNIAYALIIGGALGNLFDRLWQGFGGGMFYFNVGDRRFSPPNLAQS
ncbi:signal peptidase II, partial [Klebsiella pneumoniae]|nr:signal peptidase II [Klebsiella pneumoniae]